MKINFLIHIIIVLAVFSFTSCKKNEEVAKPVITLTELGYENGKIAYLGNDLHIEADIVAEGKIQQIAVTIHPEGEHEAKSGLVLFDAGLWEVDTVYTKFSGLKNTTFHEHLEVPFDAEVGHYHFHFTVTDMDGNQTVIEDEIELKVPEDMTAPVLTITSAPGNLQAFSNGSSITISGSVSDDMALGGLYIALVRVSQNLTDEQVSSSNTIALLHTHEFDSPQSDSFSATITIGSLVDNDLPQKVIGGAFGWQSGEHYLLVKAKDAFGANWVYSAHFPIVINM